MKDRRLRQLALDLLESQETERSRIAGELHDGIGQALAAMKFTVESGLEQINQGNIAEGQATLQRLVSMIRVTAEEIRRIQNDLQPSMLRDLGIAATLEWFCREYGKSHEGVRIEKRVTIEQEEVSAALQVTLFRLVQEAFDNIARHSKADQVFLGLEKEGGVLALTIRDDGQGFDPEEQRLYPKGKGLSGMQGRAELSGGTLVPQTEPGKGTSLTFRWPLPASRSP